MWLHCGYTTVAPQVVRGKQIISSRLESLFITTRRSSLIFLLFFWLPYYTFVLLPLSFSLLLFTVPWSVASEADIHFPGKKKRKQRSSVLPHQVFARRNICKVSPPGNCTRRHCNCGIRLRKYFRIREHNSREQTVLVERLKDGEHHSHLSCHFFCSYNPVIAIRRAGLNQFHAATKSTQRYRFEENADHSLTYQVAERYRVQVIV